MASMRLEEILFELHNQLESTESLNSEQVAKLRHAVVEIQAAIDDDSLTEPAEDGMILDDNAADASLAIRLRDAVQQFEDSHPSLTTAVGQVADMLAQMGI